MEKRIIFLRWLLLLTIGLVSCIPTATPGGFTPTATLVTVPPASATLTPSPPLPRPPG